MNLFARRLRLKAQYAGGGLPVAEMLAKAERAVETLRPAFEQNAAEALAAIEALAQSLRASDAFDRERIERISEKVHNLKGLGSTFGFVSLTEISEQFGVFLSFLLEDQNAQSQPPATISEAVDAHVRAMMAAAHAEARNRPSGSAEFAAELRGLADRFRKTAGSRR